MTLPFRFWCLTCLLRYLLIHNQGVVVTMALPSHEALFPDPLSELETSGQSLMINLFIILIIVTADSCILIINSFPIPNCLIILLMWTIHKK